MAGTGDYVTYYITEFTFGGTTYNADNAGLWTFTMDNSARENETRVSGQLYATDVNMGDASAVATIQLANITVALPTIGTLSNIVAKVQRSDGTLDTKTAYNMKFAGETENQDRNSQGTSTWRFVFQSSDGVKGPWDAVV